MVLCPFWKLSRSSFGVKVCDNLVDSVPCCIVVDLYAHDSDNYDGSPMRVCEHMVLSDLYHPQFKMGCYFGGTICFHNVVKGFDACFGCERWFKK